MICLSHLFGYKCGFGTRPISINVLNSGFAPNQVHPDKTVHEQQEQKDQDGDADLQDALFGSLITLNTHFPIEQPTQQ